jgi:gluconokinase
MCDPDSLIVMGVSGSGKSLVGKAAATALGWIFLDADDFHSEANRTKMHNGIPLTDEERFPWLESLNAELTARHARGEHVVLACSALRECYREILRRGLPGVCFIYLKIDIAAVRKRVSERSGHFFPAQLVENQFATLEPPADAVDIDATLPQETIVEKIRSLRGSNPQPPP